VEHPKLFWGVIASMYIGNLMLLGLNLPLIGLWVRLLKVPYHYMAVVIVIICIIGAYSIKDSAFDIGVMIVFGVVGYLLRKGGFPAAPLVLAMILGRILERSVQQALKVSGADVMIFIEKPISAILLAVGVLVMLIPLVKWFWKRFLGKPRSPTSPR
jgi:putative tricarboxylic transport membrane protein